MKDLIANLIALKTNVVGTAFVALLASSATLIGSHFLPRGSTDGHMTVTDPVSVATAMPSVVDCNERIYSPIQRACVSQVVFDTEMQRLFAALGIDTSIYQSGANSSQ